MILSTNMQVKAPSLENPRKLTCRFAYLFFLRVDVFIEL